MGVEIVSREIVKPSRPTLRQLEGCKPCLLHQLSSDEHVPLVLFFSPADPPSLKRTGSSSSRRLKDSLSECLTHFYPFAGQIKDGHILVPDDEGADYVEARVDLDMSVILEKPEMEILKHLFPSDHRRSSNYEIALAVQVNHFRCGGIALAVFVNHAISDGATLATFLNTWAAVSRGADSESIDGSFLIVDLSPIFPPEDLFCHPLDAANTPTAEAVIKRFIFYEGKIAALREKVRCEGDQRPTRVQAIMALIWEAVITIAKKRNPNLKKHFLAIAVNLRRRLDPPLAENAVGNIMHSAFAGWTVTEENVDSSVLLKKIRDSISKVNGDSPRRLLHASKNFGGGGGGGGEMETLVITSWCRFPFYEADFGVGLGKPVWATCTLTRPGLVVLMDAPNGKDVEVWMSLAEPDMDELLLNHNFISEN